MIAKHPTSGVEVRILGSWHWLWCFSFSFVYYIAKGMWKWALISFLTFNGLWIIFPILNRKLVRSHYEHMGWEILVEEKYR